MGFTPDAESSLVLRIRDSCDREAWEEFVATYTPLIHRYCLRRGLQDADAVDVAQEAMLAVSRRIGRFELRPVQGAFRSWLFCITRRCLADFFSRRAREPQGASGTALQRVVEEYPDPECEDPWNLEHRRWIFDSACRRVREEFEHSTWQAFWGTAVESRRGEEVARSLGISLGAVYIAKSRVLARLKEVMRRVCHESPFLSEELS